jgi:hypothetical protein
MGGELFKRLIDNFGRTCGQVPDNRRSGYNERYKTADFVKSAFGVFFFQHRSMLDYQRKMKEKPGRNNPETIFGGHGHAVGHVDTGTDGPDTA